MCDPITLASVALSGASIAANAFGSSKAKKAQDAAMGAERERQRRYEDEALALNTQSQDRYQDFGGQQEQKATSLADYFQSEPIDAGDANVASAMPQSASNITVAEEGKQRSAARDFTNKQGAALGEVRSFGDLLGGISREQARDAGQIGQIGGFMRGSASVLPYELEAASKAGDGLKLFGDVLGGLGSIGTNAGLSGKSISRSPFGSDADPWDGARKAGGKVRKSVGLGLYYG
ncbi:MULTISPECIES: hypothetical protein [unclassified Aurantimonas]|uniref:hypothetical protein n=1 Tax=unclassified Aurantimonas TaxID=2638230 RepID=UPI002E16DCF4|nr:MULTISPECIES: hypothetical protein [unclassified Aurantimonas]MEC5291594.1 hypothetical protein [Aurantimonas sp. C2-3-R2]MEC5412678.1 hypothetical protein [Aurantimonas sp. C2-4-R8]